MPQAMLVDLLAHCCADMPKLSAVARRALAAVAHYLPESSGPPVEEPGGIPADLLTYAWTAESTAVSALASLVVGRVKHGPYEAPLEGEVMALLDMWLGVYCLGEWACWVCSGCGSTDWVRGSGGKWLGSAVLLPLGSRAGLLGVGCSCPWG